jgi:hypothetical protein
MKKSVVDYFLLGIVVVMLFSGLVAAQVGPDEAATGLKKFAAAIADPIIKFTEETVAFTKTLFFILVLLIVGVIITRIPLFKDKQWIAWMVSVIVSILAVFFIPTDLILPLLNPYSALGVGIISVLPFILMFLFVDNMIQNTFLRNIAWMFFALALLTMTVYTAVLQNSDPSQYGSPWYSYIYGIASVLALVMVFINQKVHESLFKGKLEGGVESAEQRMDKRLALDKLKEREAGAQGL